VTAPRNRPALTRRPQRRPAATEAEQAAIGKWVRDLVRDWPPLAEWQRERLRKLLDLGGGHDGTA
jgi:hypothetical protein